MGLSLKKLEDVDRFVRLVIYGPPGAGKSTLAATAPDPVWLDFENSLESLRTTHPHLKTAGTLEEVKDYEAVLDFIRSADKMDGQTIVIDTLSSMNLAFLTRHMAEKPNVKDRHIARFEDFRKITNVMREIFQELITVNKHVILIAHEKYWREQETNVVKEIRPSLPPATEEAIEQLVNECFYLEKKTNNLTKQVSRNLIVSSEGKIFAKNRQGFTEATITEPTWEKIYKWA